MKKNKISQFIGRQISRLKVGQTYYAMGMYSISAIGILKIAFPQISIWTLMFLVPLMFVGSFFIGYIMDLSNITSLDHRKSLEMSHRYLTTVDNKDNDFRMLELEVKREWLESHRKNETLDPDILKKKYNEFLKKWSPPEK